MWHWLTLSVVNQNEESKQTSASSEYAPHTMDDPLPRYRILASMNNRAAVMIKRGSINNRAGSCKSSRRPTRPDFKRTKETAQRMMQLCVPPRPVEGISSFVARPGAQTIDQQTRAVNENHVPVVCLGTPPLRSDEKT
jgi:hypothetical protein